MTFAFWVAMILATGLLFGLAGVMGSLFVAGMIAAKASHDNTRAILKAIELLSTDKQNSSNRLSVGANTPVANLAKASAWLEPQRS